MSRLKEYYCNSLTYPFDFFDKQLIPPYNNTPESKIKVM